MQHIAKHIPAKHRLCLIVQFVALNVRQADHALPPNINNVVDSCRCVYAHFHYFGRKSLPSQHDHETEGVSRFFGVGTTSEHTQPSFAVKQTQQVA